MNDNIETKNLRLIFIGAGNIAQSIVKGLLNCSYLNSKQIFVYAPTERNSQIFRVSFFSIYFSDFFKMNFSFFV